MYSIFYTPTASLVSSLLSALVVNRQCLQICQKARVRHGRNTTTFRLVLRQARSMMGRVFEVLCMMVSLMCQPEYVKERADIRPNILGATLRVSKEDYHLNW